MAKLKMLTIGGGPPVLEPITITENGVYTPNADSDGFSDVTVAVEGGVVVLDEVPEVQSIENPTGASPSMVYYNGELYLLTKEAE